MQMGSEPAWLGDSGDDTMTVVVGYDRTMQRLINGDGKALKMTLCVQASR